MVETSAHPTFDIPNMGRMTAADFAAAYNEGRVPPGMFTPGGSMVALPDGRGVRWIEDRTGAGSRLAAHPDRRSVVWEHDLPRDPVDDLVRAMTDPRWADPLLYIGAR